MQKSSIYVQQTTNISMKLNRTTTQFLLCWSQCAAVSEVCGCFVYDSAEKRKIITMLGNKKKTNKSILLRKLQRKRRIQIEWACIKWVLCDAFAQYSNGIEIYHRRIYSVFLDGKSHEILIHLKHKSHTQLRTEWTSSKCFMWTSLCLFYLCKWAIKPSNISS